MNTLLDAYKSKFGEPDTLIQLQTADDTVVLELAVLYPIPDEDVLQSSIVSLGLSSLSDQEELSLELITEINGKVSNDTVNILGGVYHDIYERIKADKGVVAGRIYRSVSLPLFDGMNAVMITEEVFSDVEWLDEENEKARVMRLIPLFEKEADELEQYDVSLRHHLIIRSGMPYRDADRDVINIAQTVFKMEWEYITNWFEENKANKASLLRKSLDENRQSNVADVLEEKLGFGLPPDFKTSFNIQPEKIYIMVDLLLLNEEEILHGWTSMNKMNNEGAFKGALRRLHPDNRIQPNQWWNEKWVPVISSDTGDLYCIDMDPGPEGIIGQIIIHTNDEGPFVSDYNSFFQYIDEYRFKLKTDELEVNEDGNIVEK